MACSYSSNAIHVLRLADGARIATAVASSPSDIAADPRTGTVFVASDGSDGDVVTAWQWTGKALLPRGPVEAAGIEPSRRLVTVMPPAPGKTASHLVVGTSSQCDVRVLSLPSLELVGATFLAFPPPPSLEPPPDPARRRSLRGGGGADTQDGPKDVWGLVACPSGTAVMVCRPGASSALSILPWPLPGLPSLP